MWQYRLVSFLLCLLNFLTQIALRLCLFFDRILLVRQKRYFLGYYLFKVKEVWAKELR